MSPVGRNADGTVAIERIGGCEGCRVNRALLAMDGRVSRIVSDGPVTVLSRLWRCVTDTPSVRAGPEGRYAVLQSTRSREDDIEHYIVAGVRIGLG
jgi:hypothetical protein